MRELRGRGFAVRDREGIVQAHARADRELDEHLLQVPLDGTGAEEQPGADLRIGETVAREAGDLLLLRRELVARLDRSPARPPARRHELAAGALGKRTPRFTTRVTSSSRAAGTDARRARHRHQPRAAVARTGDEMPRISRNASNRPQTADYCPAP